MDGYGFELFEAVDRCTKTLSETVRSFFDSTRQEMFEQHIEITTAYLGQGSAELYTFVRKDLGVPFHRGLIDDPTYVLLGGPIVPYTQGQKKTIGSHISTVYEAITSGRIHTPVMAAVKTNIP
jgi:phenylalanine ammonia-lyase